MKVVTAKDFKQKGVSFILPPFFIIKDADYSERRIVIIDDGICLIDIGL